MTHAPALTLETMSSFCNGSRPARVRAYLQFLGIDALVIHGHVRIPEDVLRTVLPPPSAQQTFIISGRHVLNIRSMASTPPDARYDNPGFWVPLLIDLTDPTRHRWVSRFRRRPSLFTVAWRPNEPTVRVEGRWFAKIRPGVSLLLQGSHIALDVPDPPDDDTTSMEIPLHCAQHVLGGPLPIECDNRMLYAAMDGDRSAISYCERFPRP